MIQCEVCILLAMCVAKEKGECSLIYNEAYKIPGNQISKHPPLSDYRKFLNMKVMYVRHHQKRVKFIK